MLSKERQPIGVDGRGGRNGLLKRLPFALSVVLIGFVFATAEIESTRAQDYPRYPPAGSTFVSLDSWVYPLFERLAGLGYVKTAMMGLKPWARTECARLTDEASEILVEKLQTDKRADELSARMIDMLEKEFAYELKVLGGGKNRSAAIESVYARVLSISGPPLTDGFHFGQTIDYDFGRPFRRGANAIAGASARATYGPFAIYARAEYQQSPSAPALADTVRNFIAAADSKPIEARRPFPAIQQGRLVEGYAAVNIRNWQVSFGKQSLQWAMRGMLFSNNAEPPWMFRVSRVVPYKLPSLFRHLGPVRSEFFWARIEGTSFVRHPSLYGTRVSVKPHARFELGFGHTVMIGGHNGSPLTPRSFLRSFFGRTTKPSNPGDSRVSMDFAWHIPGSTLILYGEFFQDDEPAPFVNPGRAAIAPGLHWTRIPWIPKLDFRVQSTSTEIYSSDVNFGRLNYWNSQYRDGYVNRGVLLGTSAGRDGRQIQISSTYSFSPRDRVQFRFQDSMVRREFVPGGGAWRDYGVAFTKDLQRNMYAKGSLQLERIHRFPLLFAGPRNNVAVLFELGFRGELAAN